MTAAGTVDRLETLSPYARQLILATPARVEAPIRAELFGAQRFAEHGRSLARAQAVEPAERPGRATFFPRVEANLDSLRSAFDYIALASRSGRYVTPAAEWLLDNFHLVEAQLQQIHDGVPRSYYARLPKLDVPPLAGLPRVYGIAWAYVAHTDSVLDKELFTAFLDAYQEVDELTLGELWALPTTLRVVLLENLRRMAEHIAGQKVAREVAHAAWDAADRLDTQDLDALLATLQPLGLADSYLLQLWQRLPAETQAEQPPLAAWTQAHCPNGHELIHQAQSQQAAANLTVGNIITTLRLIGQVDWPEWIEPVSRSLRVLEQLPSFAREGESTRQQITQAMEQLARTSGLGEREVAQAVVQLASAHAGDPPDLPTLEATAGHYLLGEGRGPLSALLARSSTPAGRPSARNGFHLGRRTRSMLYGGTIFMATGLLLAAAARGMARGEGFDGGLSVLALLLLALPVSEAVISLVHRVIAESIRVRPLPRLAFEQGIPPEHAVLVVIPTLLHSPAVHRELADRLELHWLANREAHAQFALLTDWADAAQEQLDGDDALLADALAQIDRLNRSHPSPDGAPARFVLLHRPRVWSETEGRWMGWERKRGKLEMLLRLLATGDASGFTAGASGLPLAPHLPYVLTLDSDTQLPPGALRELVSIAAHPLHQPRIDPVRKRVTAGFGILQPRIVTPFPEPSEHSIYHWLFAGQCGLDPYSACTSDVYQDLFGSGSFTGKGLLHVAAVHAVLDRRLPEGAVLSHDLLEGSVARCGLASDVLLIEDHPHHAGVAASRLHRWTRGDWQLLPLMLRARRFGIDALGLWKMSDNLRRALVMPASFVLLCVAVFSHALSPGVAVAAVLAALGLGSLLGALTGLVPTRRGIEWRHFFRGGGTELARALLGTGWLFTQVAALARTLTDASVRALWRVCASRRHLLEWTTAAQAQSQARYEPLSFVRGGAPMSLLCLGLAVASLFGPHPVIGACVFLLWSAAPFFAWQASRVKPHERAPLTPSERDYFETLAQDTWRFFERVVGPDDHHLPPDNLQLEPEPTLAHRTSPTNIGMYLLACCCARQSGWIDDAQLARRLSATLDTVDRLDKHAGHLYNWYDTQRLVLLPPAYVSAVDSGNLAGHLLAVAQACRDRAGEAPAQAEALLAISARCEALFAGMDFRGLYDGKRHLFHIGLRVEDQRLDASYYDLMASESRLLSLLAIAKGDAPRRHWTALGRPFMPVGALAGLKSWSGSMFEYLMPALVMHEPRGSLLAEANDAAVLEQQAFGRAQQMPWGVSESAYFAQDHSLAYQYSPFGVPRLALRRTPPTDRVVAPYATVMAVTQQATDAMANLQALEALGARGEFGFFDAVDFTVARQAEGQACTVVRNFMAHHQGMSLVALCNLLSNDAPRRWFGRSPLVRAHESLLHERAPRQIIGSADPRIPPEPIESDAQVIQPRDVDPLAPGLQPTQLLSNGRYSVSLRANGAGLSRWHSHQISRWRDDALRDAHGTFFYVRDERSRVFTSLTALPAPGEGWRYGARFLADQVQLEATGDGLASRITVLISPEDDTELRTVTLHNTGQRQRTLELVSYFEPVLSHPRADEAHPAFANLFIDSRWKPEWRALLLSRKPRLHGDPLVAAAHFVASIDAQVLGIESMTDRRAFIGRNRTLATPVLDGQPRSADGTPIDGLDPIACLRVRLSIEPGATARVTFATTAGDDLEALVPRIDRYLQTMHVERAARMAATLAQVRLRDLSIAPSQNFALQDLATLLAYSMPRPARERTDIDRRQLWRFGISGDRPIVLVHIHSLVGKALIDSLLRAQPWWAFGGIECDLVVINAEPHAYLMPLQREIEALRQRVQHETQNSFPRSDATGFYLLRDAELAPAEKAALAGLARAVFTADGRALEVHVGLLRDAARVVGELPQAQHTALALLPPSAQVAETNTVPQGNFDATTGEFRFEVDLNHRTRRPWINVIANASFGFQVSEYGSGYTWAVNSRQHQLTPWSNDPVQDPAGEHYLLQDLDSHELLPLVPAGRGGGSARHRVRHGQGYTVFECLHRHLVMETTFFVDRDERAKLVRVVLRNEGLNARRLRTLGMAEWQMGAARGDRRTLHTWKPEGLCATFAQQRESSGGFGGSTAFLLLAGLPQASEWTCDRGEFFAGRGSLELPGLLQGRAGSGLDPCAAVAGSFVLARGERIEFSFVLGQADDADAALALARRMESRDRREALDQATDFWDELLGRLQVRTPDPLFDAMVNRWLVYQTLGCRLWAKAGFYQAGGAFGFRDQLQDAMAFAMTDPARLREQILMNASRQFPQGDVQHWWHMPGGPGVRTHFSDDLLWLPLAIAHYVDISADRSLLDEEVSFIDGAAIPEGAEDAYYPPSITEETASVYEHGARAIDARLVTGAHGLPLMGTGDWNDGMNRVGHEGRGESVWLGWFLCKVVEDYLPIARARGEHERAERWSAARAGWIDALHAAGWDGAWFRRAFFDNGQPLGSASNDQCRIDLIAQAWSVLSGASDAKHTEAALDAVEAHLRDDEAGLLLLLAPPFAQSADNPGYIQAYPPGIRENGGQYSHGAVWGLMAQAMSGRTDDAWRSFEGLSPAHRARHATRGPVYEIEPYVMPGDTYGVDPYRGRGGWSWYTGSAAWLYRAAVETLLGLEMRGDRLRITPRTPTHWPGYAISLRLEGKTLHLQVGQGEGFAAPTTRKAAGEWIDWRTLADASVVQVG